MELALIMFWRLIIQMLVSYDYKFRYEFPETGQFFQVLVRRFPRVISFKQTIVTKVRPFLSKNILSLEQ